MSKGRRALIRCGALALAVGGRSGRHGVAGAATSSGTPTTSSGRSTTTTTLPQTLAGMKSLADSEITMRVNVLTSAAKRVSTAKGLGAERGTLETYLGKDVAPLQQLDTKIQGDDSVQQATADYETIFTDFRVYRLVAARRARRPGGLSGHQRRPCPRLQAAATRVQQHGNGGRPGQRQPAAGQPEQPDHDRHQRNQRTGGDGARLHAGAVELGQRPA